MTRVLCLSDYYDRRSVGGAEVVAREVYERLVQRGEVRATVVGAVPTTRRVTILQEADAPRNVAVPGLDLTPVLGSQLMYSRQLARVADEEAWALGPDVVHVNGLHFHSTAVGIRLSRRHNLPVVATAHLADVSAIRGGARVAAGAFDRGFAGRMARAADRVVAVSGSVAEHMLALGVPSSRIVLARNGVDGARFHADGRADAVPWLRAVLVGRMVHNKGTMIALEGVAGARAAGRDVRLTVVGDGPLAARAHARAAAPDLAGAVDFTGRVADVDRWLRQSDVSLRPSFTEGLPLAVLESLSSGTPVVCSDVPGTLEAVTDGWNGIVVPVGNAPALTEALITVQDDRAMLDRMSVASVESAARFSWEESTDAHVAAFREVQTRSRAHGRHHSKRGG